MDSLPSDIAKPQNGCPYVCDDTELEIEECELYNYFHIMHLNVRSFLKNSNSNQDVIR